MLQLLNGSKLILEKSNHEVNFQEAHLNLRELISDLHEQNLSTRRENVKSFKDL